MEKIVYKVILPILLLCNITMLQSQSVYNPDITKHEARALLTQLYTNMRTLHPNIYEHISKEEYDKAYNMLMDELDNSDYYKPNILYNKFNLFVALSRDSHSGLAIWQKYIKANKENEEENIIDRPTDFNVRLFPFIFNITRGKMYVGHTCFGNDSIPVKSEIVNIGDLTTEKWLKVQRGILSGERDANRDAKISRYPRFKYLQTDSCKFGYIPYNTQDTLYKKLSCLVDVREYDECLAMFEGSDYPLEFRSLDKERIGIISLYHFYPVKHMLPFIDKAFDSLKFYQTEDLIIDLRESPGGHAEVIDAFMERITDKPYLIFSEEHIFIKPAMLTSSNKHMRKIWQHRKYLKKKDIKKTFKAGRDSVIIHQFTPVKPQEHKNLYKGRIWILTGPYSNSSAVAFAAAVQDCNLGLVVGEETGGAQNCYGNPMRYPLTGVLNDKLIRFDYVAPYLKTIRPSGDDSVILRGVIPDIEIAPNIIKEEDLQLQTLIEIIQQHRENQNK